MGEEVLSKTLPASKWMEDTHVQAKSKSTTRMLLAAAGCIASAACGAMQDTVPGSLYVSPGGLFEVAVPEMRNPFVRTPSVSERTTPDGGADVTFSVLDLGEVWRFGVRGPGAYPDDTPLDEVCDAELDRWRRDGPDVTRLSTTVPGVGDSAPAVAFEDSIAIGELTGLARVYRVEGASMLGGSQALMDVATARTDDGRVLFAVAQFDMPMDQWDFFIEDVGRRPERVLEEMAREDMKALRVAVATLRRR